jgi:hypothetical protein
MTANADIELSGAFQATGSNGRTPELKLILIVDDGYGIIELHSEFAVSPSRRAHDTAFTRRIVDHLLAVMYKRPDFGHGDPGL